MKLLFLMPFYLITYTCVSALDFNQLESFQTSNMTQLADSIYAKAKKTALEIVNSTNHLNIFKETFEKFDQIKMEVLEVLHFIELIGLVSTDESKRQDAEILSKKLRELITQSLDKDIPKTLLKYREILAQTYPQDSVESNLIELISNDFKLQGQLLSEDDQKYLVKLQRESAELNASFSKNIQNSSITLPVDQKDLDGVDSKLITSLDKKDGKILIGVDYPTIRGVLRQAHLVSLREQVNKHFNNRTYPENFIILQKIHAVRQKIAKLLGYPSFAHFDIANQMALSPSTVDMFLENIFPAVEKRCAQEIKKLKEIDSLGLNFSQEKIFTWSKTYLQNEYAKKRYNIDLAKISEYFPLDHTLIGLFDLFKKQFNIETKIEEDLPLWAPEGKGVIKRINVYFGGKFRGTVFLDLFPRKGKFSHPRVMVLRPSKLNDQNEIIPGQVTIIANVTKPLPNQVALLSFREVRTIFHEFGHALHALLIESKYSFMDSSEMSVTFGLPIKTDFVELPSQFLEFWLKDTSIIQNLSSHYVNGKPLDKKTANLLIKQEEEFYGMELSANLTDARFSLEFYLKDQLTLNEIQPLYIEFEKKYQSYKVPDYDSYWMSAFIHMSNYGAKYYSYLWTKVYSADLFSVFEKKGLLKDTILGEKYCREVLSKGGSINPKELLEKFLGRPINSEIFLRNLAGMKRR